MKYPAEALAEFEGKLPDTVGKLQNQRVRVVSELAPLLNEKAREYALHGIARRIGLIEHCIERIFDIFPPTTEKPLKREAISDVQAYLHAFVINVSGLQDNLAWTYVLQLGLPVRRNQVDLFKRDTFSVLPEHIQRHLTGPLMIAWHEKYAKEYRDSLAHRIPLYVPPSNLTPEEAARLRELDTLEWNLLAERKWGDLERIREEKDSLGSAAPVFIHSLSDSAGPVILHPQVLSDALTVSELVDLFLAHWASEYGGQITRNAAENGPE
jgi:hypothetical protein